MRLEIGPGWTRGRYRPEAGAYPFCPRFEGSDVVYLDSRHPEVRTEEAFVVGDAHALPFKDSSFAKIACSHTLEHLDNPFVALQEMRRALMEGGECHIWVPNSFFGISKDHKWLFTFRSLRQLAKEAGFSQVVFLPPMRHFHHVHWLLGKLMRWLSAIKLFLLELHAVARK